MALHATFYKGKRVFVQLHNGERFVDRWASDAARNGSKRVAEFEVHGRISMRDIRSITIYRGGVNE